MADQLPGAETSLADTAAMHSSGQGEAGLKCAECGTPFVAARRWGRFCTDKCRNDHHGRERRRKAIAAKAPGMFEALQAIAAGCPDAAVRAADAVKGLKAP